MGRPLAIAAMLLAGHSVNAAADPIDSIPDIPKPCAVGAAAETVAQLPGSGLVIALPQADCAEPPPPQRPAGPDIFGSVALAVASTPLDARWRAARSEALLADGPWASMLRAATGRDRDAQIHMVNGWVNGRLGFADDSGRDDWAPATRSFARGRGDCEDFAIAKLQLLESLGVPLNDLYLVIVRDEPRAADHAVLAVREGAALMVLDSRTDRVLRSEEVRDYRPIMSYSSDFAWTHGYPGAGRRIATGAGER